MAYCSSKIFCKNSKITKMLYVTFTLQTYKKSQISEWNTTKLDNDESNYIYLLYYQYYNAAQQGFWLIPYKDRKN